MVKKVNKKVSKTVSVSKPQPKSYEILIKCWSKDAKPDKRFILASGKEIKNIKELIKALDEMEEHIFQHHVNWERNDFYNWVKDVFEDFELAEKILHARDKRDMQLALYKELVKDLLE